ncbi:MAG: twin-arginine translocation signal domain-containing protein, partial [Cyclobacteriaceae bacterium]|nr:twin-arginine translocation signal domain-containing protein [Cyclobacteriaceae bacterium]
MTEKSRRDFLKKLGISATTLSAFSFWNIPEIKAASERLSQEDFWEMIRRSYQQSSDFINLENGYFSPQPLEVLR